MATVPQIPTTATDITAGWMQQALTAGGSIVGSAIAAVDVENIGAGVGMVGTILRCHLSYEDDALAMPGSVIVKLHSSHPETVQTARRLRLYAREYAFYREMAPHVPLRSPALLYGDFDDHDHRFVLVLEDLRGMTRVDQIDGAGAAPAKTAVRAIARMHGRYWNRVDRPPVSGFHESASPERRRLVQHVYQASLPAAFERMGSLFPDRMRRLAEAYGRGLVEHTDAVAAGPLTFSHGDFRLDNMFFGADGSDEFAVVDWQVCGVRSGLYDVAYFLSSSVPVEIRRQIEADAVEEYHRVLVSTEVTDFTHEACWRSYRQNMLGCFQTLIIASGQLDLSSQRSRQLAEAFVTRTLTAIDDLDAEEFLPASAIP
ncbi:MAG: phosphotransferase [Chloroflexota bacterium]|nr:phosphotransferase [Chloroflexota bacterium]MDE2961989.1 phosphotransferase [Chloroflexota bacterium]